MEGPAPMKLVIIGGGIAGLSAAYYALKLAPETRVTVLEASDRWGGKLRTERVEAGGGRFIVEGGPDTFLATKPHAVDLCRELGIGDRLHGTNPAQRNTYVLNRGRLLPLPDGLAMMIPTNVQAILRSGLVSWPGKARMGLDFLMPPQPVNGDESLGAFVSRRLGREAYENLIEPLMSGIYAGDGDRLSLASTFPYLRDLELRHGSLARGALYMRRQARGKAVQGSRSAFLTPTLGLAEIIEALLSRLGQAGLRLNSPAESVENSGGGFAVRMASGETLRADALILAAPAYISAKLTRGIDARLAESLGQIPYTSTATVSLAFRNEDLGRPLDGYGYVIPRREGSQALACTWTSTKFPHRAPAGFALLRVFAGRAGQEVAWSEAELVKLAREELRARLGIRAAPLFARAFVWENAMPQYNLGHPALLKQIDLALQTRPGLALAGNGYRGIGIPDCIHSGQLAAERILKLTAEGA